MLEVQKRFLLLFLFSLGFIGLLGCVCLFCNDGKCLHISGCKWEGARREEDENKIGERVLVGMFHRTHVRRKTKADNGQWQVCPPVV